MTEDTPLDEVFVSEEEYRKQQQNQENKNQREVDPDSVYPSQIFSGKFYKLTDEEKKRKLTEYFQKKQTFNRINIRKSVSKEHREDCKAVEYTEDGKWDTPWTFSKAERLQYDEEKDEWKDNVKTEHNRGSQYVLLKCNDTECMGALCVKSDDLLQMIPTRIEDI